MSGELGKGQNGTRWWSIKDCSEMTKQNVLMLAKGAKVCQPHLKYTPAAEQVHLPQFPFYGVLKTSFLASKIPLHCAGILQKHNAKQSKHSPFLPPTVYRP